MDHTDIMKYLDSLGFKHAQLGFGYLIDAIQIGSENREALSAITKELYPEVAKRHHSTASRVERAIRHAIESAHGTESMQDFNGHLTNSEFIACSIDNLKASCREPEPEIPRCCLCGKLDKFPFELEDHPICRSCAARLRIALEDRELNKRLFVAESEAGNG